MTIQEWLKKVSDNADNLRSFVGDYHPSAVAPGVRLGTAEQSLRDKNVYPVDISAPGAQMACEVACRQIQQAQPADPVARFDAALVAGDVGNLMSLFSGAWFGVPESQACWAVPGFAEAVDLLDDPPEEE